MAELDNISRVKVLLFGDSDTVLDNLQDELLKEIEKNTTDQFKAITGADKVPGDLSFIIREVMVKRYNRLGSEGMKSTSRTDLTTVYNSSDFDEYKAILAKRYETSKRTMVSPGGIFIL